MSEPIVVEVDNPIVKYECKEIKIDDKLGKKVGKFAIFSSLIVSEKRIQSWPSTSEKSS